MKCGNIEQCSRSKSKEITKQGQSKHGPLQKLEAGSGSMEYLATPLDRSLP